MLLITAFRRGEQIRRHLELKDSGELILNNSHKNFFNNLSDKIESGRAIKTAKIHRLRHRLTVGQQKKLVRRNLAEKNRRSRGGGSGTEGNCKKSI